MARKRGCGRVSWEREKSGRAAESRCGCSAGPTRQREKSGRVSVQRSVLVCYICGESRERRVLES